MPAIYTDRFRKNRHLVAHENSEPQIPILSPTDRWIKNTNVHKRGSAHHYPGRIPNLVIHQHVTPEGIYIRRNLPYPHAKILLHVPPPSQAPDQGNILVLGEILK